MLDHIWAKSKPQESLAMHTDAVVTNLIELRKRYFECLPDEQFWQDAFIAALFHDMGKVCENFQDMIQPNRSIEKDQIIRHEFISGMYLFVNNYVYYSTHPLTLFAVFSHHKPLRMSLFCERRFIELRIVEANLDAFISFAQKWLTNFPAIDFKFTGKAKRNLLQNEYIQLVKQYEKRFLILLGSLKPKDRTRYIFHKALLNIADWTASGHRILEPGLIFNSTSLQESIVMKLEKEGKSDIAKSFRYSKLQVKSMVANNVIAVAPTGSGKTEAALLWASQKAEFEHIFYLLPTRVTANAIYRRLCAYFDSKVAIVHSSAFFLQKEIDENYPEKEYAFIDKAFFKNVTICTIDQILTQGFNLGFWEVKTFHQFNAYMIIDEIHLYEPYTLGLIIATIKYLQDQFNTRFYIMTATMPNELKLLLVKHLDTPKFLADTELLNKARNTFEIRHYELEGIKKEVIKAFNDGLKVLLVMNTVDSAIQAFEYLKKKLSNRSGQILCYHSRFIQKHRNDKEKQIFELERSKQGCLLVATQVVEVSLDIDFDILFTENAPIDAIIQRAGRVNRKRKKENTKAIIFKHSEITEKYVYDMPGILSNTFDVLNRLNGQFLTERQLLKAVDEVYKDFKIEENEDFQRGLLRYQFIQKDLNYIMDQIGSEEVFTRLNIDSINVIPDKFQELLHGKGVMEKAKYEVSIRRGRFNRLKKNEDSEHKWFNYVDVIYNYETGLQFKGNSTISSSSSFHY